MKSGSAKQTSALVASFIWPIYLPLLFYMLFDQVSMKDQPVGSYQAAKKKYVILGIDDKEASE